MCAVEGVLILADAGVLGSPLWRYLAWQNGGFWTGLWHGWTPKYAWQPVAMCASYAFLHADWQHLVGNALVLVWLGLRLEHALSARQFAALYALAILGGALTFGVLSGSPRPMIGASGAIMGLMAVWIGAEARNMVRDGSPWPQIVRIVLLRTGGLAALNVVAAQAIFGGMAWQTHLGGFAAAALAMITLPALRPR